MQEDTELQNFSILLRTLRNAAGYSASDFAEKIGITNTFYSRLENAKVKPTRARIEIISDALSLNDASRAELIQLAGYGTVNTTDLNASSFSTSDSNEPKVEIENEKLLNNITLDPAMAALYVDASYISVSEDGVVIDFGQKVNYGSNEVRVVTRVGMSVSHSERVLKLLTKQLKLLQKEIEEKNAKA